MYGYSYMWIKLWHISIISLTYLAKTRKEVGPRPDLHMG